MQKSAAVRAAQLETLESTIGTAAVLKLRSGAAPATADAADTGTVVATMTLPSDWLGAASSTSGATSTKSKLGTWSDAAADAANAGGAMHWRIYASNGTTPHLQGTVSATGGGGEIQLNNLNIALGQTVEITSFDLTSAA
ncbi:hypothetical protein GGQ97_002315 [Sphingomonas kaistensis]|uniref:Uncharacterized protein n=1 Tax=Sphingomonas kaistensis TaxID=298708 RepID=A0A7X5Y7C3_9SPHN|nr:hypothetical protein [Sphingomonas kaistensis]NJC06522.1 hypothetical protein [Sphingomonas kaistensis]